MAIMTVAVIGAAIGVAFMLFDFSWATARFCSGLFGIHPATMLALSAAGGALVISAEFWGAAALWELLT